MYYKSDSKWRIARILSNVR